MHKRPTEDQMATEEGIVIASGATTARVATTKSSACEACSARRSCHTLGGGDDMEVDVLNPVGARVDDRVVIYFETTSLLKASFLLYFFPVLVMLASALIGHQLALVRHWDPSLSAAGLGFLGLALALLVVQSQGRKLAHRDTYKPKIIRILGKH
jgi:sigma-E factor negative regulatory protein RseC